MSFNMSVLITYVILFTSTQVQAEIYQWVDSQGRIQFSDKPSQQYDVIDYGRSLSTQKNIEDSVSRSPKELEAIAKTLKEDRANRDKIRAELMKNQARKKKKREKRLVAIKKKKLACQDARDKEDLAFRQRTKQQNLDKMRKALANYVKKRENRQNKCSQ